MELDYRARQREPERQPAVLAGAGLSGVAQQARERVLAAAAGHLDEDARVLRAIGSSPDPDGRHAGGRYLPPGVTFTAAFFQPLPSTSTPAARSVSRAARAMSARYAFWGARWISRNCRALTASTRAATSR